MPPPANDGRTTSSSDDSRGRDGAPQQARYRPRRVRRDRMRRSDAARPPTSWSLFVEQVLPLLLQRQGRAQTIVSWVLHLCGIGESRGRDKGRRLDRQGRDYRRWLRGEVRLRLTCLAESARPVWRPLPGLKAIRDRVGARFWGWTAGRSRLRSSTCSKKGASISPWPSPAQAACSAMYVKASGASEAASFSGVVACSVALRLKSSGVPEGLIAGHGAVSEKVRRGGRCQGTCARRPRPCDHGDRRAERGR